MTIKLSAAVLTLLAEVVAATDSTGNGFVAPQYAGPKALIEGGFIEVNSEITNPNDASQIAARVTDAGRKALAESQGATTDVTDNSAGTSEAPKTKRSFAIESNVALPGPAKRQIGPREPVYPFAELEVGQSFFVSNEDVKSGDAYKSLGSTLSTANKRFAVETGEVRPNRRDASKTVPVLKQERKFIMRRWTDETSNKEGARIFRVELEHVDTDEDQGE